MKLINKLFVYAFIILSSSSVLANGSVENLMLQANSLYQDNKFEEAIDVYEKILDEGYESEAVFYNLGNCYFRTDRLGYAILNYEKALRLAPDDEDVNYNLLIANAHTVDKIKELPKIFIVEWWEILVTSLSIDGWQTVLTVLYYLLLLTIAGYFLVRKFKLQKYFAYWGIVNVVLLVIVSVLFFTRVNREATTNYGVLIESTITAKQSPNEKSNDVFMMHEGIKFEIEDSLDDWAKIKLADGKVGWLPETAFEKI